MKSYTKTTKNFSKLEIEGSQRMLFQLTHNLSQSQLLASALRTAFIAKLTYFDIKVYGIF